MKRCPSAAQLWGTTSVQHFTPVLGWISQSVIFQPKIAFHKEAYFWTEKRFNIVTLLHLPQCTLCICMYCVVLKIIHANCNIYIFFIYI